MDGGDELEQCAEIHAPRAHEKADRHLHVHVGGAAPAAWDGDGDGDGDAAAKNTTKERETKRGKSQEEISRGNLAA